ncbi:hypothetical protein [Burkholderia arboris]|uniref:hypothetical protein n=1 Tax=Burkholderia TaxID=32008 RepID=UPI0030F13188
MDAYQVFLWGCVGGAVPDVLRLIRSRHDGAPKYVKTIFFWVMLFVLMVFGGIVSRYSGAAEIKQALAYGFSAPQIVTSLLGKAESDRSAKGLWLRIRGWWAQ